MNDAKFKRIFLLVLYQGVMCAFYHKMSSGSGALSIATNLLSTLISESGGNAEKK